MTGSGSWLEDDLEGAGAVLCSGGMGNATAWLPSTKGISEEVMPSNSMVGRGEPRATDATAPQNPGLMSPCCCQPEEFIETAREAVCGQAEL